MSQPRFDNDPRGLAREVVEIPSQIWGATLAPTPAMIINISPHGCMVRCDEMVPMGEHLTLDFPLLGALRGLVIWSLGARMGVEFETPISLEAYLNLLDTIQDRSSGHPKF